MAFCPYCGHTIEPNAAYCSSCGHEISVATTTTPTTNNQSSPPVQPPPPPPYLGQPVFGDADRKALGHLWIASIIFLASLVVGYSIGFLSTRLFSLVSVTPSSVATTPNVHFSSAFYSYVEISSIVTAVVYITGLVLVRSSFKTLERVDRPRFHVPSILVLVLLAALPVLYAGEAVVISAIQPLVKYVATHPATNSTITPTTLPPEFGAMISGAGILALGGLIGLIGLIGGIMLGLWRVGGRYDNSLIKVSAILIIIPVIDVIVPILLLIGVRQARNKVILTTTARPAPSVPI